MRKSSSTNFQNEQKLHELCSAAFTMSLISGRWKLTILTKLLEEPIRYSEIKKLLPDVTERVLILQLKQLEKDLLIHRTASPEGALKVTYEISVLGKSLAPVIKSLSEWGDKNKPP